MPMVFISLMQAKNETIYMYSYYHNVTVDVSMSDLCKLIVKSCMLICEVNMSCINC